MKNLRIGVMSDGFRLGPREGISKAAELGAQGIQIYTIAGEMAPDAMDAAARKDFRDFCDGLGIEISGLCADAGAGFHDPGKNPETIAQCKKVVDLAVDLGTKVITTHIGVVPPDPNHEMYGIMLEACKELADYAAQAGVAFAVETGPETAEVLKGFLDKVGSKGLGVNLDPANLVMVVRDDPAQAVHTLKDYIVHTHAKDGRNLRPCDPMSTYHGGEPPELGAAFEELPLGEGDVDWDAYLQALEDIGYTGFLTIEREAGDDPEDDIRKAIAFLKEKIS